MNRYTDIQIYRYTDTQIYRYIQADNGGLRNSKSVHRYTAT